MEIAMFLRHHITRGRCIDTRDAFARNIEVQIVRSLWDGEAKRPVICTQIGSELLVSRHLVNDCILSMARRGLLIKTGWNTYALAPAVREAIVPADPGPANTPDW